MKYIILVGTHHKTGTVWMTKVFKRIAQKTNIKILNISSGQLAPTIEEKRKYLEEALASDEPSILIEHHSKFPLDGLPLERFRGLRVVRDPRDLIISSAKYHTWSDEKWLHIPLEKFCGKTYAEEINSLPDLKSRMLFEMENSAGGQINVMVNFKDRGVFRTIHYEDLMNDLDLFLWHEISVYLGFEKDEIVHSQMAFFEKSLFGGMEKTKHVQDGSTKQYLKYFDGDLINKFTKKFNNDLEYLKYDKFNNIPE